MVATIVFSIQRLEHEISTVIDVPDELYAKLNSNNKAELKAADEEIVSIGLSKLHGLGVSSLPGDEYDYYKL